MKTTNTSKWNAHHLMSWGRKAHRAAAPPPSVSFPRVPQTRSSRLAPEVANGPQRLRGARGRERLHEIASIRRDETVECGHRARDLRGRQETEDANHGQAAVVDLSVELLRLLLLGEALGELERIPE